MAYCLTCGKEITKKSHKKGIERKYCSYECYMATRNKHEFGVGICMNCGREFKESRDRPNKFCSKSCSASYAARERAKNKLEINPVREETLERFNRLTEELNEVCLLIKNEKQCKNCGEWFDQRNTNHTQFCSDRCARKVANKRHDKRIYRNGKPDLSITLTKLYARDGGVCQICGRHIDFDCDSNDDRYPSIDHIIPLSKGGLHTWDNVQLACRVCNYQKSDTI